MYMPFSKLHSWVLSDQWPWFLVGIGSIRPPEKFTWKWKLHSRVRLCDPMDGSPPGSCPWNSPAKCTGVVSHFLLHFLLHIRVSYFVFYLPIFIKQHFTISTPENLIHLLPHTARSVFFDISCWTQVLKEQNPLCFRDGIGELRKILLLRKSSSSNHLIGGAIKLSPFL